MITTTSSTRPASSRSAFTLGEVIVSMGLGCILLATVVTTTLFLSKSSLSAKNYYDMESDYQRFLQIFQQDVWFASDAEWVSENELSLNVDGETIAYRYDTQTSELIRTTNEGARTLIENIESLAFQAFDSAGNSLSLDSSELREAANDASKSIQVTVSTTDRINPSQSTPEQTASMTTARWMLRNKRLL